MEKKLLRKIHVEQMARLSAEEIRAADCKICQNVLELEEYKRAENVFLYISVGNEVSTADIVRHAIGAGKKVYIPRCQGGGIMHAVRLEDVSGLVDGMYGIPTAANGSPSAAPQELDFILVPGVCFDRLGHRLGRGGGYYDRYLAQGIKADLVGVCRSAQLLDVMRVSAHDRGVDIVVTDAECVRIKA